MRIYIIGKDGITLCREPPTAVNEGEIVVASNAELHAARISGKQRLPLWNALSAGLDTSAYGMHWMRRTMAVQIYKKTSGRFSFWGTRSWRARCAISGSRSVTLSPSRSNSSSD